LSRVDVSSLIKLQRVNPGFNPEEGPGHEGDTQFSKYKTNAEFVGLYKRVLESVKPQPGVQDAALASSFPLKS